MALLKCTDLSLGYDGKTIVEGLDFEVNKGDYLCIVGENGSGKSTLMKTLLGLQSPISGKIITSDGLKQKEIGYLPQQTPVQRDFPASVREIVMSGCINKGAFHLFYSRADKQLAEETMKKLNIFDISERCYRELSGGQQQRVLLARALCATSKLLLLDEPTSGLDPKVTLEMYDIIESINKKDGITVIMISHDIEAAVRYADHILHIDKDIFFGTKEEYLNSEFSKSFSYGGKKNDADS
ncbi:MAG: metal ABC transporter ATP-binding protein [Clostridia bacterium]|nr:metal ABC transporter ATP-binding protein [Clostridia bacterium]